MFFFSTNESGYTIQTMDIECNVTNSSSHYRAYSNIKPKYFLSKYCTINNMPLKIYKTNNYWVRYNVNCTI